MNKPTTKTSYSNTLDLWGDPFNYKCIKTYEGKELIEKVYSARWGKRWYTTDSLELLKVRAMHLPIQKEYNEYHRGRI